MVICSICGKEFFGSDYEICYNCFIRENGYVLCKKCKKHYHNPDYDECRYCFFQAKNDKARIQRDKAIERLYKGGLNRFMR